MDKNSTYVNVIAVKYEDRAWLAQHTIQVSFISVMTIVIGLYFLDLQLAQYFRRPDMDIIYKISREITNIGWSVHYFAAAIVVYILSKTTFHRVDYFKEKPHLTPLARYWALFLIKCLLALGLAGQVIKIIFGRQRPHAAENFSSLNFAPFSMDNHWWSFPSGHSQVLFTFATVLLLIWPRYRFWFLGAAVFFAFTRVTTSQHFFSDFIAGGTLGYLGTLWLHQYWPYKKALT